MYENSSRDCEGSEIWSNYCEVIEVCEESDVHGPTATFSCKNSPPMCLLQHSHGTRISQVDGLKGENQTSEFRTVMWVDWHWPKKGFTHALNSSFSDHWPVSVQYWKRREEKEICN